MASRKTNVIEVRVTPEEKTERQRLAQNAGLSLSDWLRFTSGPAMIAERERLAKLEKNIDEIKRAICPDNTRTRVIKKPSWRRYYEKRDETD